LPSRGTCAYTCLVCLSVKAFAQSGAMVRAETDVFEVKGARVAMIMSFLCLAVFTDYATVIVANTKFAKVPEALQIANYIWIGLSALIVCAVFLAECKGIAKSKGLLVLMALMLPFNSMWFYNYAGSPALIAGKCMYYKKGVSPNGAVVLKISAPGEVWPPEHFVDATVTKIPTQAACNSVLSTEFEGVGGLEGRRWEEFHELALRLFGFAGGVIADLTFNTLSGGFAADITDAIDLYLLSYKNVNLMIKGNLALSPTSFAVYDTELTFNEIVMLTIIIAYFLIFLRVVVGHKTLSVFSHSFHVGHACGVLLSLFQEVAFMIIRLYACIKYGIPVSVLILKNIVGVVLDLRSCCQGEAPDDDVEGQAPYEPVEEE